MNKQQKHNKKLQYYSGGISFTLVFIMAIIKVIGYYISGSVSIMASFIDSGSDFFTTIISLIAITASLKPADRNHGYGHEKAGSIGALFEGTFIFICGIFLLFQAIHNFIYKPELSIDIYSILIMVVSLILTCCLVLFQRYVYKKTNSIIIKADILNYTGDIFTTLAVIVSLLLTKFLGISNIDIIFGLLIALFLCKNAKALIKESLDVLMDKEIDKNLKNQIKHLIKHHENILGFHDFRTRFSGNTNYIEIHVELDGNLKFKTAHEIVHQLKDEILKLNPNMQVIIHEDIHNSRKRNHVN